MENVEDTVKAQWFQQHTYTDSYIASNGFKQRIPIRLRSSNTIVYGAADLEAVLKDFEHEEYTPVRVGGKVPVQIWFNNFYDTDCGPEEELNPYLETWYSFPVTKKDQPMELPLESPFSYNVTVPTNSWCHRVLCSGKDGFTRGAENAVCAGREVWGFPKHPALGEFTYKYENDSMNFTSTHQGNKVLDLSVQLPESTEGHVTVPLDLKTESDTLITPRQSPLVPGFIPHQTRYGTAFSATMNFAPWDASKDSLTIHGED
jgi:hypothetical protein